MSRHTPVQAVPNRWAVLGHQNGPSDTDPGTLLQGTLHLGGMGGAARSKGGGGRVGTLQGRDPAAKAVSLGDSVSGGALKELTVLASLAGVRVGAL